MATQTGSFDFKAIKQAEEEASKVATNYMSSDSSGIMIYDGTNGQQTPSNPSANTKNVFIDSDSVDIRQGPVTYATFGMDGSRVGPQDGSHIEMKEDGFKVYDDEGSRTFEVSTTSGTETKYASATIDEKSATVTTDSSGRKTIIWSLKNTPILSEGVLVDFYINETAIYLNIVFNESQTEQTFTYDSKGFKASISGRNITLVQQSGDALTGLFSVHYFYAYTGFAPALSFGIPAEDLGELGSCSVTLGSGARATGYSSFACGELAVAEGSHSFAHGGNCHANNEFSFASGEGLTTDSYAQAVFGTYNEITDDKAFVIGNGQRDTARSNAFTVDKVGNVVTGGHIFMPNGRFIQMKDSNGAYRNAVTYNSSNQFTFGNGSYTSSTGGSYYDGNSVNLRYKTNLTFNNNTLQNMFTVTSGSVTLASTAAGANKSGTITLNNTGWTPLGVVGYASAGGTNPSNANIYRCYLTTRTSGQAVVTIYASNCGTSAMAPTIYAYVLWVRNT